MTQEERIDRCYEAIREGATVEDCVENLSAVAFVDQLRALPGLSALQSSLPFSDSLSERHDAFLKSIAGRKPRPGILDILFGTPRRGATVGLLALFAVSGVAVAAAQSFSPGDDPSSGSEDGIIAGGPAYNNGCGPEVAVTLEEDEVILCEWGRSIGAPAHERHGGGGPINNSPWQVARLRGVASVAHVGGHVLVVRRNGTVEAFPDEPLPDNGEIAHVPFEDLSGVVEVDDSLFLRRDGTVWIWNDFELFGLRRVGLEDYDWTEPIQLEGLQDIVDIDANLGLTSEGAVYQWGMTYPVCGAAGIELPSSPVPRRVEGLGPARKVSAGHGFSLALLEDGTVWAWGSDAAGQLGNSPELGGNLEPPSEVDLSLAGDAAVVDISAGSCFSLAALSDGRVLAWGSRNESGLAVGEGPPTALGDSAELRSVPVALLMPELPEGVMVKTVLAAGSNSAALLTDGTLLLWGDDSVGQLADGPPLESHNVPTLTPYLVGVTSLPDLDHALIGRCAAPDCDPTAADVPVNPAILRHEDLAFDFGLEDRSCGAAASGRASEDEIRASELFFDLEGIVEPGGEPTAHGGTCKDNIVVIQWTDENNPAGYLVVSREFYEDPKPRGSGYFGLMIVSDPSAVPHLGPVYRIHATEVAGRPAILHGTMNYDADGTFLGWGAGHESCAAMVIERSSTADKPGIVWTVRGPPCDQSVTLLEQLLERFAAEDTE
ncbi:MAG: hypothetical protein WEB00_05135 [Dehalococcoidia bacterium]